MKVKDHMTYVLLGAFLLGSILLAAQTPVAKPLAAPPLSATPANAASFDAPVIIPREVLESIGEIRQRLLGASAAAAAVEQAAKAAATVRDDIQMQFNAAMGPYCKMAKIDLMVCSADLSTGIMSAKAAVPSMPPAKAAAK